MNITKSFKNITTTLALATLVACSSGGSCPPNLPVQEAGKLVFVAPSILPSLANKTGVNYMGVYNPSKTTINGISYNLGQQVGAGSSIVLDPASAKTCASIAAQSSCFLKFSVPESTIAGGAVVTATNSSGQEAATPLAIGIQQVPYTESANANGIGLYFYPKAQYSANGVPFILVTAVVQSPNVGNINTLQLVDESGNVIPDQTVISNNSGTGKAALQMGDVVEISLPIPQGINLTQNFKVQTSSQSLVTTTLNSIATKLNLKSLEASSNGNISSTTYTLTTQGNNINLQLTPNQVYLTQTNPLQYGYLYNIGDLTASQITVTSSSPNVRVTAADTMLNGQRVIKITYELINTSVAATSNVVTVTANNPAGQTQTSTGGTSQNVNPLPVPTPSPTPTPTPTPSPTPGPNPPEPTKFWTLISGGTGQPKYVKEVFGSPTPQNIVVSADNAPDDFDRYLWTYNNGNWSQLCNGQNGTPGAGMVLLNTSPTINDILWYTGSNELWAYKNGTWSKLLDASATVNTPAGEYFGGVVGNSNTSFIVGTTTSDNQLWMYNNASWIKLTGGANQPANVYMLSKAGATANSITIYDSLGNIWFYNGSSWIKIGDGTTPPNPYASTMGGTFYGVSTSSSIIFTPGPLDSTPLWIYDGSSWSNVSGSSITASPVDVSTIFGTPANDSLVIRNNHDVGPSDYDNYSVWTLSGGTWTNMTTGNGSSTPKYGWMVYGSNATPSQFFMSDLQDSSSANLWEWANGSWSKKTGGSGAPSNVGFVGGNPTTNSFVMIDGNQQLWTSINGTWANITSHVDEPVNVEMIYGLVNPDSIVATHYVGKLEGSELWIGKR